MSQERVIYLSELSRFFKKNRGRIVRIGIGCFAATFAFTLIFTEPSYRAEAAFRQAQAHSEEGGTLQSILHSIRIAPQDSSAVSVMRSKRLLFQVIEKAGLQVVPLQSARLKTLLLAELSSACKDEPFLFENVRFEGEYSRPFFIRPLSNEDFEILDQNKKKILIGKVGEAVHLNDASLTISRMSELTKTFGFVLIPKRRAHKNLAKGFQIKANRHDANILQLSYRHPQRESSIRVLDTIMEQFQSYLQKEHEELATLQLGYLQQRRDQLGQDFDQALEQHVAYLQQGIGAEGFLGLAQEIELLNEPKEKYSAKKHQLDLELKKWKEPKHIAAAEHPWKEGTEKMDELQWMQDQIAPAPFSTEEFAGVNLETAEQLHQEYAREREQISSQIATLEAFGAKMIETDCELSPLSQILTDEVSQKIIQKATETAFQIADRNNYSEKELKRLTDVLSTQKKFLQEHIFKKLEMLQIKFDLIEKKMRALKQLAFELIGKEKEHVEQKLAEISAKMGELPEKWRLESQLKLKKELTMQIIEGVTQLSESKVVNHHLFHVESKPLDPADAPPMVQPPHLILYSSMGGLIGALFFFIGSFLQAVVRGLPISADYLRDRKLPFVSKSSDALERIALEIERNEVVALIGAPIGKDLGSFLAQSGWRVLQVRGDEPDLMAKLKEWKRDYDVVLIEVLAKLDSPKALRSLSFADRFILNLNEERAEDLSPYTIKKLLCLLS